MPPRSMKRRFLRQVNNRCVTEESSVCPVFLADEGERRAIDVTEHSAQNEPVASCAQCVTFILGRVLGDVCSVLCQILLVIC